MQASEPILWALVDDTGGAPCGDGTVLTQALLQAMATACTVQLDRDFGANDQIRVASSAQDIQPGERVYAFRNGLPEAPGALAYHSTDGAGVEFGMEDFASCSSVLGPGQSASSALSHECLETRRDRGCNLWADDGAGMLHAYESSDAVEVQSYPIDVDGVAVYVSNFLLDSWFIPGHPPPYDYMSANGLVGAVAPPGPMQTAAGNGGNYQTVAASPTETSSVFAARAPIHPHVKGTPRNAAKVAHWSSRTFKRLHKVVPGTPSTPGQGTT